MTDVHPMPTTCSTQVLIGPAPIRLSSFETLSGSVHVSGIAPGLHVACDDLAALRRLANGLMTLVDAFETGDGVTVNEHSGHRNTSVIVGEPLVLGVVE